MDGYLSVEELEGIRKWSTCAVANAIELFNIRPRNQGFMLPWGKMTLVDTKVGVKY